MDFRTENVPWKVGTADTNVAMMANLQKSQSTVDIQRLPEPSRRLLEEASLSNSKDEKSNTQIVGTFTQDLSSIILNPGNLVSVPDSLILRLNYFSKFRKENRLKFKKDTNRRFVCLIGDGSVLSMVLETERDNVEGYPRRKV